MVMGERVESLCEVEAEHYECDRPHHLLLERNLLKLSGLFPTFLREQVVLVLIELFLYLSTKHFN